MSEGYLALPGLISIIRNPCARSYAVAKDGPENKGSVRSTLPLFSVSFHELCKFYL